MKTTRPQTSKFISLVKEYKELKAKLFGPSMFAVWEDTPEWRRYDQLSHFFNPQFRTKDFINPLDE